LITVEDAAELRLEQPHVVRLETRPASVEGSGEVSVRDLVRNALRMRPDRLIVGEVRGAEAMDLVIALNTGHRGALSTVHANSPAEALRRVEMLALMAGLRVPYDVLREQLGNALELILHLERTGDGVRRAVTLAELVPAAGGIGLRELWGREGADCRG
jgi:pilus assembly protein CpaF